MRKFEPKKLLKPFKELDKYLLSNYPYLWNLRIGYFILVVSFFVLLNVIVAHSLTDKNFYEISYDGIVDVISLLQLLGTFLLISWAFLQSKRPWPLMTPKKSLVLISVYIVATGIMILVTSYVVVNVKNTFFTEELRNERATELMTFASLGKEMLNGDCEDENLCQFFNLIDLVEEYIDEDSNAVAHHLWESMLLDSASELNIGNDVVKLLIFDISNKLYVDSTYYHYDGFDRYEYFSLFSNSNSVFRHGVLIHPATLEMLNLYKIPPGLNSFNELKKRLLGNFLFHEIDFLLYKQDIIWKLGEEKNTIERPKIEDLVSITEDETTNKSTSHLLARHNNGILMVNLLELLLITGLLVFIRFFKLSLFIQYFGFSFAVYFASEKIIEMIDYDLYVSLFNILLGLSVILLLLFSVVLMFAKFTGPILRNGTKLFFGSMLTFLFLITFFSINEYLFVLELNESLIASISIATSIILTALTGSRMKLLPSMS